MHVYTHLADRHAYNLMMLDGALVIGSCIVADDAPDQIDVDAVWQFIVGLHAMKRLTYARIHVWQPTCVS